MTDPAVKTCKLCKGPVNKLISATSFHLKGSGWYATNCAGKKAPTSEAKKDDAVKSETTETAKTESTPKASTED